MALPDISLNPIFVSMLPFVGLEAIGLMIVLFFPQVALRLPSVLY